MWRRHRASAGAYNRAASYSRRYARPNADIAAGADDVTLAHVDDLVTFLAAIDASPAHLVGNSSGCEICLFAAIRHPEQVRTLILEEPAIWQLVIGAGKRPQPGPVLANL